jgi:hypothetical protein
MKVVLTESQYRALLVESYNNKIVDSIVKAKDFGKEVVETASNQMGMNFKFLLTYGAGVGALAGPIMSYLRGEYPELSSEQIMNIIVAAIAVTFFTTMNASKQAKEKLEEEGLENELDSATNYLQQITGRFGKVLSTLGDIKFNLIDILAYSTLLSVIPFFNSLVSELGPDYSVDIALRGLAASVGLTMFGSTIKTILKRLAHKVSKTGDVNPTEN